MMQAHQRVHARDVLLLRRRIFLVMNHHCKLRRPLASFDWAGALCEFKQLARTNPPKVKSLIRIIINGKSEVDPMDRAAMHRELQEPWSRHKVIVSTESSFKSFWSNVQQDDVKVGHELSNGTCFFSIVREPVSWMQSSYNHALRHGDLEWHMLHETNNFQTAYFEDIADVARRLTIFSTDRAEIVYEAMKRLLGLENVPEVCDVAFDGKSSNVRQSSSRGYDKSVEWSAWVRQYNGVDVRLFDALKGEYDGFLHIVAPEGQTVGSVQSAASFFDVVKDFQWEQPPPVETYRDYIKTH